MKTIGFVCEGPRDSDLLEALISHISGAEIAPLYLQPDASLVGENGNGWRGVWSWCMKNGKTLDLYMEGATPKIDLIIVQMDGDVARKEREAHCSCYADVCPFSGTVFPPECKNESCPVMIPCELHQEGADGYVSHLRSLLCNCFPGKNVPVCVIPCDSTDAWIVAAFENGDNIEEIHDPWTNIISRGKEYHGIRIPGHKKTKKVFDALIPAVKQNWESVKRRCPQAEGFDRIISSLISAQ